MTSIYFVKCFISMGLSWSLYKLFLENRKSFLFNRGFLLFSIIGLPILPFITLPSVAFEAVEPAIPQLGNIIPTYEQLNILSATAQISALNTTSSTTAFSWSWVFYMVGFLIFIRILFNVYKLTWMAHVNYHHKEAGLRIIQVDLENTPFSFFNNLYVSSGNIESGLPDEIILHETCHINQFHSIDRILAELILIIQWWNPFAFLLIRSLKENHEYTADDYAVRAIDSSHVLVNRLMNYTHRSNTKELFQIEFAQMSVMKRIKMIYSKNNNLSQAHQIVLACIFVAIAFSCTDMTEGPYNDDDTPVELSVVKGHLNDLEYIYPTSLVNKVQDPHFALTGLPEYRPPSKMLFSNFLLKPTFKIVLDGQEISKEQLKSLGYEKIKAYKVYDISHFNSGYNFKAELYTRTGYFKAMEGWLDNMANVIKKQKAKIKKVNVDPIMPLLEKYEREGGIPADEIPKKKLVTQEFFKTLHDPSKYNVLIDYEKVSNEDLLQKNHVDFSFYIIDQVSMGRQVKVNLITNETFDFYVDRMKHGLKKKNIQ